MRGYTFAGSWHLLFIAAVNQFFTKIILKKQDRGRELNLKNKPFIWKG
jgi:hypothetical protein